MMAGAIPKQKHSRQQDYGTRIVDQKKQRALRLCLPLLDRANCHPPCLEITTAVAFKSRKTNSKQSTSIAAAMKESPELFCCNAETTRTHAT
jgi:hypothetical protein